ncbi:tRNA (adenosine(37)-N6)-threonylcarbamoyltransferase complex ATPase subunit type 1 TsaE [Yoonia sp.]|uniref:tRNA (adenosine(37)-N6)-threonylcarbamoyltransferase complex ATPase subunit type 1 TsaE n=1 Tax=Yoonia sp. TaxID=2212373 RepID=UPI002FD8FC44
MATPILTRQISDETAMAAFAARLAPQIGIGDTLLLSGSIGAGKSAFARGFIRAKLGRAEDVPSPTFTLVQTYDTAEGEIWHCDLYRLTHPDEALELGLDAAFETAICLIEWPDRLGDAAPENALHLAFSAGPASHEVVVSGNPDWQARAKVWNV